MRTEEWPAATTPTFFAPMKPRRRLDAGDRAVGGALDALHLAVLDDVHAARRGAARITPGDRVVAGRAAAPLQRRAHDRIARVFRDVERRAEFLRLLGRQELVVDAVQPVGVDVALQHLEVVHIVRQHHDAARRIHDVVVQILGEPVPQLQRVVVDAGALVIEVVGADDGGVAAGIAAAEPALFQHRDIGDAVLLGEVVGGGEAMAAGADDDDIVFRARLGRGPLLLPALVAAHGLPGDGKYRIFPHAVSMASLASLTRPDARCTTSEKPMSPLRCLRRRLPFCAVRQAGTAGR